MDHVRGALPGSASTLASRRACKDASVPSRPCAAGGPGGIQSVAMESTGVYWKPVWNILEAEGLDLLLANAQEVKIVPGRKTDQKDSQWIADLHQHGLLRKSFVPPRQVRDLR